MEVTQKTWKTAADWQKNGSGAAPVQKPADDVSVFGAGVQDIEPESIDDIMETETGYAPNLEAPDDGIDTENINKAKNLNGTQKKFVSKYGAFEGNQSQAVMQKYNLIKEGVSLSKKFVTNDAAATDKMILSPEELKQKFGSVEKLVKVRDELKESVINDLEDSGFNFNGKKGFSVELACSDCVRTFEPGQTSKAGPKCKYVEMPKNNTNPADIDEKTGFVGTDIDKLHGREKNHPIYHAHTDNQGLIVKIGVSKPKGKLRDGGKPVNTQAEKLTNFDYNDNNQKTLGTIYNLDKAIAEWNK